MNKLQRDVLTEGLPDFEQALLKTTVSAARRTHRMRYAARYSSAVAGIAFVALLWFPQNQNSTNPSLPTVKNNASSLTSPTPSRLVTIRSKQFPGVLRTKPLRMDQRLASRSGHITLLRTSDLDPEIRQINDEQLLSLLEGQAVALIGRGPNARLIFPESTGTK